MKKKILKKIKKMPAEEYYKFDSSLLKILNIYKDFDLLSVSDFDIIIDKEKDDSINIRIDILQKLINSSFAPIYRKKDKDINRLTLSADKALNLLLEYQKSGHLKAGFYQYNINFLEYFPQKKQLIFRELGSLAAELNYNLYLVGGQLRDLLLGLELNDDVDLLLEGDIEVFFSYLKQKKGWDYILNDEFKTGYLRTEYRLSLDFATCRQEKYKMPGSPPSVKPSGIFSDLYRRDFTLNSMAVDLTPSREGILYDFFAGLDDLEAGILHVLHKYSFRDDPLRILRGIRFRLQKGFVLSPETKDLARYSLKKYDYSRLSLERIFTELNYLLSLEDDISILADDILNDIPVLKLVTDNFKFNIKQKIAFKNAEIILSKCRKYNLDVNYFLVRLIILFYNIESNEVSNWPIKNREFNIFKKKRWISISDEIFKVNDPAQRFRLLEEYKIEELILYCAFKNVENYTDIIIKHFKIKNGLKIPVSGYDILKMGFKEGPIINEIMLKVRDEILRGNINDRKDALEYIKKLKK
ncbi:MULTISPECIES: CCA tRNA nucleotidyltransferase [unclassified Halanaerobium]|uniref:CCA tRNA nucleotidyltransferase n=1 Tax=unclassified Halanaerobium TaxID=2641197 RepID=UPI000DF15850|nr:MULTISPECIES: CCA tRNA nucleotidyltransferase [unclassified Halanaerobium]RCW50571.1 poly(A) polymerase/tRNA nucleotidyltransferase (CCA-adding enzyme) [Halanaerobium sp. MA284_MarDTE_T2]RCW82161.1 poly(A) polymerase/tRNA nucleotidyltransferase (CCA-adding enzyme) [Halanaerobium sp. DL-01]